MLEDELKYQIKQDFVFCPTKSQQLAIDTMVHFLLSKEQHPVMILRGFAGTGKTSIASAMVRMLRRIKWNVELLAPTGRAAKVFSAYSKYNFTILTYCTSTQRIFITIIINYII